MKKLIILILLFTTACTKYTDLKNISIIKSIGIDYQEEYTIYFQIYDEINKNNIPKTKLIKVNSLTINDAFAEIKNLTSKKIMFDHIDLLILSTNLNDDNYREIINYFLNNNFRNDEYCILSDNNEKLLNKSKYNEIENSLDTNNDIKKISLEKIMDCFLNNKPFTLSKINYDDNINYNGNYTYYHKLITKVNHEK